MFSFRKLPSAKDARNRRGASADGTGRVGEARAEGAGGGKEGGGGGRGGGGGGGGGIGPPAAVRPHRADAAVPAERTERLDSGVTGPAGQL